MENRLPNQAHFLFEDQQTAGESDVILNVDEVNMLHAQFDNKDAEFDISIEDMAGNVQFEKKGCKNPSGRWGERIDLPVADSYYKVRLSNVSGAKSVDVFLE